MEKFGADCGAEAKCKSAYKWVCPAQQQKIHATDSYKQIRRYKRATLDKKQHSKKFILGNKKKSWSPYDLTIEEGNKMVKRSTEDIKDLKQHAFDKSFEVKASKINGTHELISEIGETKISAVSGLKSLVNQKVQATFSGKREILDKSLETKAVLINGSAELVETAVDTKAQVVTGAKYLIKHHSQDTNTNNHILILSKLCSPLFS